jgi:hypothetical protein
LLAIAIHHYVFGDQRVTRYLYICFGRNLTAITSSLMVK